MLFYSYFCYLSLNSLHSLIAGQSFSASYSYLSSFFCMSQQTMFICFVIQTGIKDNKTKLQKKSYYYTQRKIYMSKISNSELLQQNGISALSFSKNGSYCAIGTKKNLKVYLFEIKAFNDINTWIILQQSSDHNQTISDIDWSVDQKILTVSHDRSVYVWKRNNQKWEKMLVTIDVRLSILACKWASSCKKFALAACPTSLIIGYYSVEGACWAALVKDKIVNVPIVSIDFHPSCNIIALGSLDGSVKIVSCSFKSNTDKYIIESKIEEFPYSGAFQTVNSFGEVLFSIDNVLPNMKIWINHLSFENNGKNLLLLTHSNHSKFYDVKEGEKILVNERDIVHKTLPFANGLFNSEKQQLILAGFDRKVSVFSKNGDNFKFDKVLERNEKSNKSKSMGLVTGMLKGIQKKDWVFGEHPKPEEHSNTVKVVRTRGLYVSYDLNGIVHFWE